MSLKQSVVIVNEYTVKTGSKSGSRGGTPGDYVLRYMARNLATEDITPVRLTDADTYITKYMARKSAVESLDSVPEMKVSMRKAQKNGGVAFGYGEVSLSDNRLKAVSKDIQNNFDNGKTVMKTVLSFDMDYLKEHGIIDKDFEFHNRGDFRGNIDQLKLRLAIMNGLERLSRHYDDLQYVGVIQVDTAHVHCHLAMVDRGRGHIMPDGTQRGKITEREKVSLRRGIDMWLDEKESVKMMSSSVMYDKRNALCYIKKFTHKSMSEQGFSQFLVSCLPENKNWWRASTNRKEMRKANALVREFVTGLLAEPKSGYADAVQSIERYASFRKDREGLSDNEYNKLIRDGQERVIEDCMNAVYSVVKQIPESERVVRTPMLDAMSQDYDDMAAQAVNDPMVEFGFRLRSYSSRLDYHKKEYHKYADLHKSYEDNDNSVEDSKPLDDYFQVEMLYNAMLMSKYQHFLSFLPPEEDIEDEFEELMEKKRRLRRLKQMKDDPAFKRMKPDVAEDYGIRVYGQYGGRRVKSQPNIIDARIEKLENSVNQDESDFRDKLRDCGMDYDGHGITRHNAYDFNDVKSLDLHHMGYDFPYDVQISKPNIDKFCNMAAQRYEAFEKAREYLVLSNQEDALQSLPEKDVEIMKDFADKFAAEPVLVATRPNSGQFRKTNTIRLGRKYEEDMKAMVASTVRSLQLGEN